MQQPSQQMEDSNEPGEISLDGLNPSIELQNTELRQCNQIEEEGAVGSPQSGEMNPQAYLEQSLITEEFSLTQTPLLPATHKADPIEQNTNFTEQKANSIIEQETNLINKQNLIINVQNIINNRQNLDMAEQNLGMTEQTHITNEKNANINEQRNNINQWDVQEILINQQEVNIIGEDVNITERDVQEISITVHDTNIIDEDTNINDHQAGLIGGNVIAVEQVEKNIENKVDLEPAKHQALQIKDHLLNNQAEQQPALSPNEPVITPIEQYPEIPLQKQFHKIDRLRTAVTPLELQTDNLIRPQQAYIQAPQQTGNDYPLQQQINVSVEEETTFNQPQESPLKLLSEQSLVDNQPKQLIPKNQQLQLPLHPTLQITPKNDHFQKQPLPLPHLPIQKEPSKDQSQSLLKSKNMNQLIEVNVQQIHSATNQEDVSLEAEKTEQKHIIQILEEMDHDEETPVFGGPDVTQNFTGQIQNVTIAEQEKSPVQQEYPPPPVPIQLEQQDQKHQGQQCEPNPQLTITSPPTDQISESQTVQAPKIPQLTKSQPLKSSSKAQIVIESEQEDIVVPQKVPEPFPVENMKLNAESIRKLLLEADSDWTELIRNASEVEILQFYEELTNKIEISAADEGETQQQQHQNVSQQPSTQQQTPATQAPEPIQQQSQTTQHPQAPQIIPNESQPTTNTPTQQPPTSIQLQTSPKAAISAQNSKEFEEFEMITAALFQSCPELKQQITKLSNEELRALYRQTMEENRRKQQSRNKNKKKKNTQPVIDLEEQVPPSTDHLHDSVAMNDSDSKNQPNSIQTKPQTPTYSYLAEYQKRKSEAAKQSFSHDPSNPLYVNKTLLYSLLRAHDYQNKLRSVLMPKESAKYQQKTEREIAVLYLKHLKKNKIAKGPFEAENKKIDNLTVLCRKKEDLKGDNFKKVAKEGLCLRINTNLSEQKRMRILELRQRRTQGTCQPGAGKQSPHIPAIENLPLSKPLLSGTSSRLSASQFTQMPSSKLVRRYCLIMQEELSPREEEEIGLQSSKKRVKRSSNGEEEKELLGLLRQMIELEE